MIGIFAIIKGRHLNRMAPFFMNGTRVLGIDDGENMLSNGYILNSRSEASLSSPATYDWSID
jgi:hypothetical protein